MENVQTKTQELFEQVVVTAWENSEFKSKLMANPIETLEEVSGGKVEIPNGKTLVVLDEVDTLNRQPKADETYLIIPENTYELTEEQLETVAGGVTVEISVGYSQKDGWSCEIKVDFSIF